MNAAVPNQQSADFAMTGGGTVYLFHPWLALHCPPDGQHQYLGNALTVEHRFVADIVAQAQLDCLKPFRLEPEGRMN